MDEDQDGIRQTDEEIQQMIADRNNARLKMYEDIADSNDEGRKDEFDEIPDDAHTHLTHEKDDEEEDSPAVDKFRLKVNGKEVELTRDELIARAQKVESADQYLAEASRMRQEALKLQSQPSATDVGNSVEDDLALVRAIQMGSEEEAVQAIRKLKSPSIQPDDFAKLIDERMTFQEAVGRFQTEYNDLMSDPILRQVVLSKDAELIAQGDTRSYWDRYEAVGNEVREWVGGVRKTGKAQDKQSRKASVTQINQAASRVATQEQEEPDDSPSALIAQMARSRGQVR